MSIHLELSNDTVLPCPFCGNKKPELYNTHTACYWLECDCGAQVSGTYFPGRSMKAHQKARASAIEAWNRREYRQ